MLMIILLGLVVFAVLYNNENRKANKLKRYSSLSDKKGAEFEEEVVKTIKELFPEGKVLQNVIIPNGNGKGTTELDILILSKRGNFVLECKNYSGFVVGQEEDDYWTIFYNKTYKQRFYSPLRQNARHVKCLRNLQPKFYFQNIVLFSNNTRLSKELFKNENVMRHDTFKNYLTNVVRKKEIDDTEDSVEMLYDWLSKYQSTDKTKHIEYVKKVQESIARRTATA